MSKRDIADQIKALYGVEISPELVSKISERIVPQIVEWQSRALDEFYPFVFMDAVHYKVREDGRVITKAAYVVLDVNMEGYKEILGDLDWGKTKPPSSGFRCSVCVQGYNRFLTAHGK